MLPATPSGPAHSASVSPSSSGSRPRISTRRMLAHHSGSIPSTPQRSKSCCRIRASPPSWSITCPPPTRCPRRSSSTAASSGTPGELTYAKDIHRYYEAHRQGLRPRARCGRIGKSEEGRDMVAARDRRRSDDQATGEVQGDARAADRSAEDDGGAGAAADEDRRSRSTG